MASEPDDFVVLKDEKIQVDPKEKQSLLHARWALILSVLVVSVFAVCGMTVLMYSFFQHQDAPAWAQAVETAVMTAALALIFRDRSDHSGHN